MKITFITLPKNQELHFEYQFYKTPIGNALVVSWEQCLVALTFATTVAKAIAEAKKNFPQAKFVKKETVIQKIVLAYLKNPHTLKKALTLAVKGTSFQKLVWKTLLKVPFGKTISYSELAKKMGTPNASRAVASAVAGNLFAVLIPCHRVVPKSGGIGKYRWGVKNKKSILDSEKKMA